MAGSSESDRGNEFVFAKEKVTLLSTLLPTSEMGDIEPEEAGGSF